MADKNNQSNVSVGKPMVGGAVFRAPLTATLPTSSKSTLGDELKNMGYISDDGVTNGGSRETSEIKAWGGDTVLQPQTGKADTFQMTFLESINLEVLKAIYGEDNVEGSLDTEIKINVNSDELDYAAWVIDMILTGNVAKRLVIPNGKITEIGDVVYKDDEAIGFEATITAFPGEDGDTHKEYIAKRASSTQNTESEESNSDQG